MVVLRALDLRDHSTAIAATAQIVRNFVDTPRCIRIKRGYMPYGRPGSLGATSDRRTSPLTRLNSDPATLLWGSVTEVRNVGR